MRTCPCQSTQCVDRSTVSEVKRHSHRDRFHSRKEYLTPNGMGVRRPLSSRCHLRSPFRTAGTRHHCPARGRALHRRACFEEIAPSGAPGGQAASAISDGWGVVSIGRSLSRRGPRHLPTLWPKGSTSTVRARRPAAAPGTRSFGDGFSWRQIGDCHWLTKRAVPA